MTGWRAFTVVVVVVASLQATEAAQGYVKTVLSVLNEALATRTFLVGERVTLADITCVCNLQLLYKQVKELPSLCNAP